MYVDILNQRYFINFINVMEKNAYVLRHSRAMSVEHGLKNRGFDDN